MNPSVEQLLGFGAVAEPQPKRDISFSFLFFSDVRTDVSDAQKYNFMRDLTLFADREGFQAVYLPERHFYEFGSIFANSAVIAAYLIPQTQRVRFRTAGISLPLHHPAEVVEWWAMNDILSGGRVDLGFGSGWNQPDFILSPDTFEDRRQICSDRIPEVQKLWRGETLTYAGPGGKSFPINVFPRPIQKELNVWLLAAQNEQSFHYAGTMGYNLFTMLYGVDFDAMAVKIHAYRRGREEAGLDPQSGIVTLMLHTLIHEDRDTVRALVEEPFKAYIKSSLKAHVKAGQGMGKGVDGIDQAQEDKMLQYAFERYYQTAAMFGTVEDGRRVVEKALAIGVNDIACVMDFGMDYDGVMASLPHLKQMIAPYLQGVAHAHG